MSKPDGFSDEELRQEYKRIVEDPFIEKHNKMCAANAEVVSGKKPQFVKAYFNLIDDWDWLKKHRNDFTLYVVLCRYIRRQKMDGDVYDIYNRYYQNNKLAALVGEEHLAKVFGYKIDKRDGKYQRGGIQRMLRRLKADGAYILETIPNTKPWLNPVNVYVLGELRAKVEHFYWGRL